MKNYKVKAIRFFRDSNEIDEKTGLKVERKANDEFFCTKERYEFLKQNNAVKLIDKFVEDYDNVDLEVVQECKKEQETKEEMKEKTKKKRTSKK